MLDPGFNPKNTVIIHGKESINDYSMEELRKYSAIFLTEGSVDQNSGFILKQYVDAGNKLLPNIVEDQQQISQQDIDNILKISDEEPYLIPDENIISKSFEKKIIKLDEPVSGFLVLSERYSMFPGWNVNLNNKKLEIQRANGVVSTIHIDNESGDLLFKYSPKSYRTGYLITLTTILLLIVFFVYRIIKKKKVPKEKTPTES